MYYIDFMSTQDSLFHGDLVSSRRCIYTASSFALESLLYLQETGTLSARKEHISKRDHLNSYLFFYVHNGSGILHYEGTDYSLSAGDAVFIDCRNGYWQKTSQDLWSLSWVHFNGNTMPAIYRKYQERGGKPAFHMNESQAIVPLLEQIYEVAEGRDYIRDMYLNELIAKLLTILMKESWDPEKNRNKRNDDRLEQIREFLDTHFAERILLDDLSQKFFINKYYLTRVFGNQYGCSIDQYLMQKRITFAKEQLRFTDKTLEVIARECGLNDAAYLSRVFRKIEKINPGAYRSTWKTI